MKLDLESAVMERNKIIGSFPTPMQFTQLVGTDISDHRSLVENIRKRMITEAGVVDRMMLYFERAFGHWN